MILEQKDVSKVRCYGHFLVGEGFEAPLVLSLSISNLAIAETLSYIQEKNLDKKAITKELMNLTTMCPKLFPLDSRYPFCYDS